VASTRTLYVIHGVQKSSTVFDIAAERARKGDDVSILFTREARRHAADRSLIDSISFAERIYCLTREADVEIEVAKNVELLDYPGWVALIEGNEKIISWA